MQIRSLALAALLGALPLMVQAQTAPQTVTLRYKFTPGQTLRYKMTMDMDGTVLTGQSGAGIPIKQHMEMVMRQTVKDVRATDGAATITSTLESMTATVNGQPLPTPDAAKTQDKELATVVMTPTGKMLSTKLNSPPGGAGGIVPGMDMNGMTMFQSNGSLPDAPVKIGDAWKSAITAGMAGMQMQVASSLSGIDTTAGKTVADIAQTLGGTFSLLPSAGSPLPMKMMGRLNGTGTQKFDIGAGALTSQTSTSNLTMTMIMNQPAGAAPTGMPTSMKMQFHINTDMERLPDTLPATTPAQPTPAVPTDEPPTGQLQ